MRSYRILAALLFTLIGCTPIVLHQLDQRYGSPDPQRYVQPSPPVAGAPEYWRDVRPILEQRCVSCHGCYDAPCQQNLTAWDGIARGANPDPVYSSRLRQVEPSRLFIDAQTPAQWRAKNFHPVLNERADSPDANLDGSVMYRLLDLKRRHPLPDTTVLDADAFSFALNREQTCPKIETMEAFEKDHPLWGMPYGLPALADSEFATLEHWLRAGAPAAPRPALPTTIAREVVAWERFFNGRSNKQRLMSRYIYEHIFLAHLHFDTLATQTGNVRYFFRMVRSSTPPGSPVVEIPTRRPYDDPGVGEFWYRLRLEEGSIVTKTHMPYALNDKRREKWMQWFLRAPFEVPSLPSYATEVAANPFVAFRDLPVNTRYRFLLDEAQFAIDNFIKGPVCRGQVALGVIDDHFWVFFIDPEKLPAEETAEFLAQQSQYLRLPAEDSSNARVLDWLKYSDMQKKYLAAKARQMNHLSVERHGFDEHAIWNGDTGNDNAALTVMRHNDSATAVKGLVGPAPKTAWVLGYTLMERIHYLLVAGYDVYGGLGHQLSTRLYMDFMRMEGEANFLALLPAQTRPIVRDHWYRQTSDDVKNYLYGEHFNYAAETGIRYHTNNPQQELFGLLRAHVGANLSQHHSLDRVEDATLRAALRRLAAVHGSALAHFPQNSILRVDTPQGRQYFTLINNSGYSNNSELLDNGKRRLPEEDDLSVVPGFLGAYPNVFFRVMPHELDTFTQQLTQLGTETDYRSLADRFAIRRTSRAFWAFSDALQRDYLRQEPVRGGILDYNRLENR